MCAQGRTRVHRVHAGLGPRSHPLPKPLSTAFRRPPARPQQQPGAADRQPCAWPPPLRAQCCGGWGPEALPQVDPDKPSKGAPRRPKVAARGSAQQPGRPQGAAEGGPAHGPRRGREGAPAGPDARGRWPAGALPSGRPGRALPCPHPRSPSAWRWLGAPAAPRRPPQPRPELGASLESPRHQPEFPSLFLPSAILVPFPEGKPTQRTAFPERARPLSAPGRQGHWRKGWRWEGAGRAGRAGVCSPASRGPSPCPGAARCGAWQVPWARDPSPGTPAVGTEPSEPAGGLRLVREGWWSLPGGRVGTPKPVTWARNDPPGATAKGTFPVPPAMGKYFIKES